MSAGKMEEDFERESGDDFSSTAERGSSKKIQEVRGSKKIQEPRGSEKIQKVRGSKKNTESINVTHKFPDSSRLHQKIPESISVSQHDPKVRSSSVGGGKCASSCTREQIVCDQQSISQMDSFVCNLMLNKCVTKCGQYANV